MRVSIIVPAFNEEQLLAATLAEIRNAAGAFAEVGWTVELIVRLMAGSFICVEAAAFRSVGGFDQEMFAAEEIGLSQRLKKLACGTPRRVVILHRHPLTTSARKVKLYSLWEWLWLLVRVFFTGGRALRNPQATHLWYDGRR